MFQYRAVLVRLRQGDSDRDIARARLMGRPKVAALRALAAREGWLASDTPLPEDAAIAAAVGQARRARSTVSSVEPFRATVARWAEQGVNGVAIHAALCREHGYSGSYSAVRRMLGVLAASRAPEATVRLQFAPGEAAQVDFGAGPKLFDPARDEVRRTWCFVMTLCFSRHQYVEFVWDQTVATWLGCHRRAFEWFTAVPGRLIIDNPKCAITKACARDPLVARAYAECAEGYGFKIDPCPPADPAKKGVVEAGVKYVKGNFLPTRSFRDLADLNAQARRWVLVEAGVRVHGTTREQPLVLFELEKPLLRTLPAIAPDLGTWSAVRVHRDCHVQFERCYYSVPFALIGQQLWLRATDAAVAILTGLSSGGHPLAWPQAWPALHRARSPASRGASLLRPRPRLVRTASHPGRAGVRAVHRAAARRSHRGAPARRASHAATGRALWQRAPGSGLCARARPRQPVLSHGEDHPRRRLRPATDARPAEQRPLCRWRPLCS